MGKSIQQGISLTAFEALPWTDNHDGQPRQVGVEMEMAGVEVDVMAEAVMAEVGGHWDQESAFSGHVRDAAHGDYRIELDASILTTRGYLDSLKKLGIELEPGELRDNLESVLSRLAGVVVPHELVCPPLPVSELPAIESIRARLHRAGARGTQSSALYAFGLQFNIEIHERSASALLDVLRAFFLRYPGIVEREGIDLSRKLTPFVQPFPEDYVVRVLDLEYAPDLNGLIDDYLRFTPTRNRPLDLLPLFAWLDERLVAAAPVEHHLIKPRPTWHYRLPNCLIDDPDWSLHGPWAEWVAVERLAIDSGRLRRVAADRLRESSAFRRWLSGALRRLSGKSDSASD